MTNIVQRLCRYDQRGFWPPFLTCTSSYHIWLAQLSQNLVSWSPRKPLRTEVKSPGSLGRSLCSKRFLQRFFQRSKRLTNQNPHVTSMLQCCRALTAMIFGSPPVKTAAPQWLVPRLSANITFKGAREAPSGPLKVMYDVSPGKTEAPFQVIFVPRKWSKISGES